MALLKLNQDVITKKKKPPKKPFSRKVIISPKEIWRFKYQDQKCNLPPGGRKGSALFEESVFFSPLPIVVSAYSGISARVISFLRSLTAEIQKTRTVSNETSFPNARNSCRRCRHQVKENNNNKMEPSLPEMILKMHPASSWLGRGGFAVYKYPGN